MINLVEMIIYFFLFLIVENIYIFKRNLVFVYVILWLEGVFYIFDVDEIIIIILNLFEVIKKVF